MYELFNNLKKETLFGELNITLNQNLNNFLPHLYSIIKHCQNSNSYPIYYKYWKNILREVLKEVREAIPEYIDNKKTKRLIPDNTNVLIGFIQKKQKEWLDKEHFYNIRLDNEIDPNIINAEFLLLYDDISNGKLNFWKNGLYHIESLPKNRKAKWLTDKGYKNPSKQEYIIFKLSETLTTWSLDKIYKIEKPKGIKDYIPFSVTLTDLMKIKKKD